MVPERLLAHVVRGEEAVPCFAGAEDHGWLTELIERHVSHEGRPRRDLDARLAEPLHRPGADRPWPLAAWLLGRLVADRVRSPVPPRVARAVTFRERPLHAGRAETLAASASALGLTVDELESSLLADLPPLRLIGRLPPELDAASLAQRLNLTLAQGMIARSSVVTLELEGHARAIVRQAHLGGLICAVTGGDGRGCRLQISGPFALFRRTRLYARALTSLVPLLGWCRSYELEARCLLGDVMRVLRLRSGDPLPRSPEPRLHDSRLEKAFADDFARLAPDWDLLREPRPVEAKGTLIFPDFALWPRDRPEERWLLEIVGWWTPGYLARKLAMLRAAGLPNLLLCIDEKRNCAREELPAGATVLRFRRRVDAAAVLRALASRAGGRAQPPMPPEPPDLAGPRSRLDPRREAARGTS